MAERTEAQQRQFQKKLDALRKILTEMDKAIEERDVAKVSDIVNVKLGKANQQLKGEKSSDVLGLLNILIQQITNEMKPENGLEADEIRDLVNIRNIIIKGKEPFQKTEDIVKALTAKGFSKEELKTNKENKKSENLRTIEAAEEADKVLAEESLYVEMNYIDPIKENQEAIKKIQKIKDQKDTLALLDPTMDAATIDSMKGNIRTIMSELSADGIDISGLSGFESDLSLVDSYVSLKIFELQSKSNRIAIKMSRDAKLPDDIKNGVVDVNSLNKKYEELIGKRQKVSTKITKLKMENDQIDKTIKSLEKEEFLKNVAYNDDGTSKSDWEIFNTVDGNADMTRMAQQRVETFFSNPNNRKIFPKLRDRMDYYKENGYGGVGAFFKAIFSTTKRTKRLAEQNEKVKVGKEVAEQASEKNKC